VGPDRVLQAFKTASTHISARQTSSLVAERGSQLLPTPLGVITGGLISPLSDFDDATDELQGDHCWRSSSADEEASMELGYTLGGSESPTVLG
jgi:hypothetical protein